MEPANALVQKLYSPGQIALAAFLGSPLAACWFWSRNYMRLGQSSRSTQCLIWGTAGTAALLTICFFLPERFPNQAIPIGYTFGLLRAAKQTHGSIVAEHLSAGGRLGSWWTVVGISLLVLVVVLAILFGVILVLPDEE